jgi:Na+-transporting methylmalonyl-CoA/oxaloacetate decarboxylase gamma subunit
LERFFIWVMSLILVQVLTSPAAPEVKVDAVVAVGVEVEGVVRAVVGAAVVVEVTQ